MPFNTAAEHCLQGHGDALLSAVGSVFFGHHHSKCLSFWNLFTIIFYNVQEQLGAVFSISQIKVFGTQGGMPRGHPLFYAHQWALIEPRPWTPPPHPRTRTAASMARPYKQTLPEDFQSLWLLPAPNTRVFCQCSGERSWQGPVGLPSSKLQGWTHAIPSWFLSSYVKCSALTAALLVKH